MRTLDKIYAALPTGKNVTDAEIVFALTETDGLEQRLWRLGPEFRLAANAVSQFRLHLTDLKRSREMFR